MPSTTMDGHTVLTFRINRGWTQAQAAAWYGVKERSWRRWENGERSVPVPLINRIKAWRPGVPAEVGK